MLNNKNEIIIIDFGSLFHQILVVAFFSISSVAV